MVAKCANPTCSAEFHRLMDGTVFMREVRINGARELRYAWLCDDCSTRMTVKFDEKGEVEVLKFSERPSNRVRGTA